MDSSKIPTPPSQISCSISKCHCDGAVKPCFGVIVMKPKTRAIYRVEVLLDLPYCQSHSAIISPFDILTPSAMDDLEARLKGNGRIKNNHTVIRRRIGLTWVPITNTTANPVNGSLEAI